MSVLVVAEHIRGELRPVTLELISAAKSLGGPVAVYAGDRETFVGHMKAALHVASIVSYAQGLDLLRHASKSYEYGLNLADVAKIWRGGCIIRAALLEDIRAAYQSNP